MPVVLNTEFNYRTQVEGETVWAKIKTLNGFLEGRLRAVALEEVGAKKYQAKVAKLKWLKETTNLEHEILELEAEIIEIESTLGNVKEAYELNRGEVKLLHRLLAEAHELAEPTRIPGYSDEQMFEANAANEFTVWIAKEIQAEIIAYGRPSSARLRNAMSCPATFEALKNIGLIPEDAPLISGGDDPLRIELTRSIPALEAPEK
jgi:predicted nuclease with TOPRIM domain